MSLIGTPEVVATASYIRIPFPSTFESANGYDYVAILGVIELCADVQTAKGGFNKDTDSVADHISVTLVKPVTVMEATRIALRLKAIIEAILDETPESD